MAHDNLPTAYSANLPNHPAGSVPLDEENKQRLDNARQDYKQAQKTPDKLTAFLLRIADEIENVDREKRLRLFRSQIKAHQYMDGNFRGYVDANLEWRDAVKGEGEVWYSDNQLYPYFRTALMEMSRSQTAVLVNAIPGADENLEAAAKFAQSRYDANRSRTFSARLKQTENAFALLNGITYRYTFADFGGRSEKLPKMQQAKGETQTICAMCSRPVPEQIEKAADTQCPSCGSKVFTEIQNSNTVIGYEDIPLCENKWIVPNPIGVIVSMQASCIEETPFIKWKQLILRSVLQSKYKGVEFPSTDKSVELRYITDQKTSTPADQHTLGYEDYTSDSNTSDGRELELLEFQQIWLDYPVYCNKTFDEDIDLGRGKTLKAGQPLGSAYEKGLYYARVGDVVPDIWNEDKNRKWVSSPYGMRPGSMYGTGSAIALPQQELINDLKALEMANAWSNGVPREFVDPSLIKELSADPQIPTNVEFATVEGNIIGRAYAQAPATNLSAEVYGLEENAKASMQNTIGALSGTGAGGLQDTQKWGDTATAISIKRDLAVGRFAPDLELMADQLDREQAYQFLENEKQYFTPKQWEQFKGEHGANALKAFLDCDIRRDLIITISPGSYMPKSDAQVQAKLIGYAEVMPLLAQLQDPELIAYAAEVFGIPEHLAGWSSDRAYANRVVKRFEALATLFIEQYGDLPTNSLDPIETMQADPATGQPVPVEQPSPTMLVAEQIDAYSKMPVDVFLDNHEALIDAYKDWRTTDAGRDAPNVLIAAVALRLMKHQEGIAKQGQLMTRTAQAIEEPLREQAKQDQAEMMAGQEAANTDAAAAAEEQATLEAADRMVEYNDRDEQRNAETRKQESQQMHEKDLEAMKLLAASNKDSAKAE